MKYFAEALVLTLIISILALLYALSQIIVVAMQEGYITMFIPVYILGFISPILIYVQLMRVFTAAPANTSGLNTTMSNVMGMLR
jgi:hypothetical protein